MARHWTRVFEHVILEDLEGLVLAEITRRLGHGGQVEKLGIVDVKRGKQTRCVGAVGDGLKR